MGVMSKKALEREMLIRIKKRRRPAATVKAGPIMLRAARWNYPIEDDEPGVFRFGPNRVNEDAM